MAGSAEGHGGALRRARRYRIHVPAWYRSRRGRWRQASTVNVGCDAALIRCAAPVPPVGTLVRLRVALRASRGWQGADITSTGRVVRLQRAARSDDVLMTVAIITSRFERRAAGNTAAACPDRIEQDPSQQTRSDSESTATTARGRREA